MNSEIGIGVADEVKPVAVCRTLDDARRWPIRIVVVRTPANSDIMLIM